MNKLVHHKKKTKHEYYNIDYHLKIELINIYLNHCKWVPHIQNEINYKVVERAMLMLGAHIFN